MLIVGPNSMFEEFRLNIRRGGAGLVLFCEIE